MSIYDLYDKVHLPDSVSYQLPFEVTAAVIERVVKRLNPRAKVSSKGWWSVRCFQPSHDEQHPSCAIHATEGHYTCRGCGAKGSFRKMLISLGIDPNTLTTSVDDLLRSVQVKTAAAHKAMTHMPKVVTLPYPKLQLPAEGFRELTLPFLKALGCYAWYHDKWRCRRCVFPVMQGGELIGWFARRMHSGPNPEPKEGRYFNHPSLPASVALYPYDYTVANFEGPALVLVEGGISALTLIHHYHIPAMAVLGAENFNEHKAGLIKAAGFSTILIAFDNDTPGIWATEHAAAICRAQQIKYQLLTPPPDQTKFKMRPDPRNPNGPPIKWFGKTMDPGDSPEYQGLIARHWQKLAA